MTPAEFRTLRDALGLSAQYVADRLGVHINSVWRYEHPQRTVPVPESAARAMHELRDEYAAAVEAVTAYVEREECDIPRHADLAEFDALAPTVAGWGAATQSLVLTDVQARVQVGIVWA